MMDKKKAQRALDSFLSPNSPIYHGDNEPATKGDIRKLKEKIAALVAELIEASD